MHNLFGAEMETKSATPVKVLLTLKDRENKKTQLCRLANHKKPVIVKSYRLDSDPQVQKKLKERLRICSKARNPSLQRLLEVNQDKNRPDQLQLLTEYLPQGRLLDRLRMTTAPFTNGQVLFTARELSFALKELHELNVAHKMVRPSSIYLKKELPVLAAVTPDDEELELAAISCLEGFLFTPPEGLAHRRLAQGKAADIWCLGVTLFFLRFGKLPAQARSWEEFSRKLIEFELPQMKDEEPMLVTVLQKTLEKKVNERWTAAELCDYLLDVEDFKLPGPAKAFPEVMQPAEHWSSLPAQYKSGVCLPVLCLEKALSFYQKSQSCGSERPAIKDTGLCLLRLAQLHAEEFLGQLRLEEDSAELPGLEEFMATRSYASLVREAQKICSHVGFHCQSLGQGQEKANPILSMNRAEATDLLAITAAKAMEKTECVELKSELGRLISLVENLELAFKKAGKDARY